MGDKTKVVTPTKISKSIRTRFFVLQMVVILILGALTIKLVNGFSPLLTDSEILKNTILTAFGATLVALVVWYLSYKIIAMRIRRQIMNKELEDSYTFSLNHAASSLSLHIVYFISMLVIVWLMLSAQNVRQSLDGLHLFKGDQPIVRLVDNHSMKQIEQFYQADKQQKMTYLGSNRDVAYFKINNATISLPLAKIQFYGQDEAPTGHQKQVIQHYHLKDVQNKKYLKPNIYISESGLPKVAITKMYQHYEPQPADKIHKLDIK